MLFRSNNGYGIWQPGSALVAGTVSNCLLYANTNGPLRGHQMTSLWNTKTGRDPRFVNPAALDYRLQTN